MTTLNFAAKYIKFNKPATPITGPFRIENYRFLEKPMWTADDIRVRMMIVLKASSSMGSVLGEIINTKRVACDVGDQIMVCQTEEKAENWSKTRGKDWLKAIPNISRLISNEKYAITNKLWQFRHKDLFIFGPGINNAQSDQVRFLQTDESHLDAYLPGALTEWGKRCGGKWHSQQTHITTAPDDGKEIANFYLSGNQDEWNLRCPKCNGLIDPIWSDVDALKAKYNGEAIFVYRDSDMSPILVCPHCSHISHDNDKDRFKLNEHGDYVEANPSAAIAIRSFRWPVFAMHSIAWTGLLAEYRAAMDAAKLGDLKPHEDWIKKRECRIYFLRLPDFGGEKGVNDYKIGDEWENPEERRRFIGADYQAGKGDEGAHLHAVCAEYDRLGNSRRVEYRRLDTFEQLHQMAVELGVQEAKTDGKLNGQSPCVIVDSGHENRLVFRECSKYGWYAYRGSDLEQYHVTIIDGQQVSTRMPYSKPKPESGIVGEKQPERLKGVTKGALPPGWAFCIVGDNNTLYGYLSALVGGSSGRYFGIAKDMPEIYVANMPAFIAINETDKKTNKPKPTIYKRVRKDHFWDCEVMALALAMKHGHFPLAISQKLTKS